jgi:hypothetical protein
MIDSGTMILLISVLASAICVLCMYSVYGNVIRHETTLHDLRNRVETLQNQQSLHMAEIKGHIMPEAMPMGVELPSEPDFDVLEAIEIPVDESESDAATQEQLTSSSTKAA